MRSDLCAKKTEPTGGHWKARTVHCRLGEGRGENTASRFKTYDKKIQADVSYLINNLQEKFRYTEQGAKEVCIYVIDNDLPRRFSKEQLKQEEFRDEFIL